MRKKTPEDRKGTAGQRYEGGLLSEVGSLVK